MGDEYIDWSQAPSGTIGYAPATDGKSALWYGQSGTELVFNVLGSDPRKWYPSISTNRRTDIIWRESVPAGPVQTPRIAAHEFLERGVKHMRDRAVQRDSDAGERSMARAVAAFNAQEGTNLTEAQGWRFMIQLKYARAVNGVFVADDYEDMAAYAGLAGEAVQ